MCGIPSGVTLFSARPRRFNCDLMIPSHSKPIWDAVRPVAAMLRSSSSGPARRVASALDRITAGSVPVFEFAAPFPLPFATGCGNGIKETSRHLSDLDMLTNKLMYLQPSRPIFGLFLKMTLCTAPRRVTFSSFFSLLLRLYCSGDAAAKSPARMTRTPSSVNPQFSITSSLIGTTAR